MKLKDISQKIQNSRKAKIAILAVITVLAITVYFIPVNSNKTEKQVINNNTDIQKDKTEQLENVLSNIKGCGKVSVMITYESGDESVCASNTETQTNTVTENTQNGTKESSSVTEKKTPVTIGSGGGEDALVVIKKEPKVKGVIVVAQGAENIAVKVALRDAVETVLQISPSQVEIFAMN